MNKNCPDCGVADDGRLRRAAALGSDLMPRRKPTTWRVHAEPKYAQDRLLEIAKLAGWDPVGPGAPDTYLEERIRDWLQIKETLRTLRRMMV